jgi:putative MATE family efflux protein
MSDPNNGVSERLLTGSIIPLLLRFSLPNMLAMLATAVAVMAETRYVGEFGAAALAGMALVFPFMMLQTMMSAGSMGGGVSSAVSRSLGAGDLKSAHALAAHAFWISLIAGSLFTLLMSCLGQDMMAMLGGRDETLTQALAYCEVAFKGSVCIWIVNIFSSVIRGCGNMRTPSVTLFSVALLQVLFGGALGLGWFSLPQMGMRGVALGVVIANALGAVFLMSYLTLGYGPIKLRIFQTQLSSQYFYDILKVGLPACLSPFQTVLTILVLTRLVAAFGTQALAGYGIGARLEFLLVPIAFAIGVASVPLVGMAMGSRNFVRARQVSWSAAALATILLGAIGVIVVIAPGLWSQLFTQDPLVLESSSSYFLWAGPGYAFFGLGLSLYFSSLGAGRALGPVLAGTLRLLVVGLGGTLLLYLNCPAWMVFALVSIGMLVYGLATVVFVKITPWAEV